MRHLSRGIRLCAVLTLFVTAVGCGGGGGGGTTPLSINSLDGQTDIPVGSSFQYTFAQMMNSSTVTGGSFFILPTAVPAAQTVKAAYDPTLCNAANALAASVTCESTTQCTLDPDADLQGGTSYSICLSPEIQSMGGVAFEGFLATFTTAGGTPTAALKVVRLDGTKLDLTAKPIPLRVAIEATFSVPMDQATVEAAMSVTDDAGTAIPGTFAWNTDFTVATYTLSQNLRYQKTYHVVIAATASSKGTMTAVDQPFTTMTRGDVNGDGYADVVVGADSAMSKGIVYLFSGATIASDTGPGNAMATITGNETDGKFGTAVSAAGDVNGDGYADVLASAPYADAGHSNRGVTYLFSGATLTGTVTTDNATASFAGEEDNLSLGTAIAILPDTTNDGCDEIGVASHQLSMGATGRGGAYIFTGSTTIAGPIALSAAHATIRGGADLDALGNSIAAAGDVNGDGTPDVIIGATSAPGGANNGAVYLFSGATLAGSIDANASTTLANITGMSGNDFLGSSVAGPGDINGDGRDDVAVTARGYNSNAGAAYFFDGATLSGTKTADQNFCRVAGVPGPQQDGLGIQSRSISGIGDFNADGRADIIVSAQVDMMAQPGKVFVFSGADLSSDLTEANAFATLTPPGNEWLGYYLSGGGDVNADGVPDFVIGAWGYPDNMAYKGRAYVFSGATLTATTTLSAAYSTLTGAADGDYFGTSVSTQ